MVLNEVSYPWSHEITLNGAQLINNANIQKHLIVLSYFLLFPLMRSEPLISPEEDRVRN